MLLPQELLFIETLADKAADREPVPLAVGALRVQEGRVEEQAPGVGLGVCLSIPEIAIRPLIADDAIRVIVEAATS